MRTRKSLDIELSVAVERHGIKEVGKIPFSPGKIKEGRKGQRLRSSEVRKES